MAVAVLIVAGHMTISHTITIPCYPEQAHHWALVGASLWLSCPGLSLGGSLELKEKRGPRQVEK